MSEYLELILKNIDEEAGQLIIGTQGSNLKTNIEFALILDKIKDVAESIAKIRGRTIDGLAARINKMMEQEGFESLDIEFENETKRITPDLKYSITCKKENEKAMIEWMKQDPKGAELVKETVHQKSLQAFFEEVIISGGKPQPFVNVFIMNTIKSRKLPK